MTWLQYLVEDFDSVCKGIVSRDFEVCFLGSLDRSVIGPLPESVHYFNVDFVPNIRLY
jgi:hypothetical protein